MSDPFNTDFFNALDRVTTSPSSFTAMLEYFRFKKPEQWVSLVESLMEISRREFGNVHDLGTKLEVMIDDYALYIGGEEDVGQKER